VVARFAQNFVENEWLGKRLPQVYYDPRSVAPVGRTRSALHAKCVVIDGQVALVTSANFTEAAQERNIEVGLLVHSPVIASQVEEHFRALIRGGYLERLPLP
jgi:phosphatidylserine/phosphatidylglycerophosphate/cardiolipin synthase-like enzyme